MGTLAGSYTGTVSGSIWDFLMPRRSWVASPAYRAAINAIVNERVTRGVSQRELARRLGKPASFVNKIELLERRLDILEFVTFARALNVEPKNLFRKIVEAISEDFEGAARKRR
jgi:ribosome-binding protein aMBF1 (putative translation factor)